MLKFIFAIFFVICLIVQTKAQPSGVLLLEKKVYTFNNNFEYDKSVKLLRNYLNSNVITNEEHYYCYLFLSYTYKRLYDYVNTQKYLDIALLYGMRTDNKYFFINNVICQKSFIYFDLANYSKADSLMQILRFKNYKYVNQEDQSKLLTQEAYILFKKNNFLNAEKKYDEAIKIMLQYSPCDMPMIYVKKIELYFAMNNIDKALICFDKSMMCADSCKITKYKIYSSSIMKNIFYKTGNYKMSIKYWMLYDSLFKTYNVKENIIKLREIEGKYEAEKSTNALILKEQRISSDNRFIIFLIAAIIIFILLILLYIVWQRRKKLEHERLSKIRFTKQILDKTEEERKRIASDLHDSINHELLGLKSIVQKDSDLAKNKIDSIIDDIRIISRNLHPVLFDEIGLTGSINLLVDRVQTNDKFLLTTEIDYKKCLSSSEELQLYRILQEAISNILKYANAIAAKVTIVQNDIKLSIEIKDNGNGFNVAETLKSNKSFGLHNIIERSEAIGGLAKISSNENGTIINIEIPLNKV